MKSITLAASLAVTLVFAPTSSHAERAPKLPIKTFAQLPQLSGVEFSPNGQYFLSIRPISGKRHMVVQNIKTGEILSAIPPFEEFEIDRAHWINDDRLALVIRYEGIRNLVPTVETRLVGIDKDGKNARPLVKGNAEVETGRRVKSNNHHAPPQIQDDIIHFLPDDPEHILLAVDGDHDGRYEVRKLNVYNGKYKDAQRPRRGIQNWIADSEGNVRYGWGVDTDSIGGAGRTLTRMSTYFNAKGEDVDFEAMDIAQKGYKIRGFSDESDHVYLIGKGPHGLDHIILYDMKAQSIVKTIFEHETHEAQGLIGEDSSGRIIGVVYSDNGNKVHYIDPVWQKRMNTINKALPDTTNTIMSSSANNSNHLINASSAEDAGLYYLYNEDEKKIDPIIEIRPGLYPENMAKVSAINYKARDGMNIPAFLTVPRGVDAKNLPTVIMPHGGPHAHDTLDFDWKAQFLANRGYAVLQPNFRGSTGYGDAFYEAGKQQWGLAMQDDVTDGTKWMVEQGIADPERMCIVGASYGGYAAMMGAVKEPDLYKCAVSINGVSDIPRMLKDANNYIGGTAMTQHVNHDNQEHVSPARRADEIKANVLLIAAEDDRTVDIKQSELMNKALKRLKKPNQFIRLEEGGHSYDTETARINVLNAMEKFLKENIGN